MPRLWSLIRFISRLFVEMWNKSSWHRQNIQHTILSTTENYSRKYVWEIFALLCFLYGFFCFKPKKISCSRQYSRNSVQIFTLNGEHNTTQNTSFTSPSISLFTVYYCESFFKFRGKISKCLKIVQNVFICTLVNLFS